ncbi:3'(2'),5'-bisphosphate nucleotidase 1-like isoform X2 [Babylonia areolata]|uniref:3'(2'),5'-bisphosphate nucleotidase 1-like isoform X2 n=1 Tax=Babylonia areolata TaxID=304850 RepID=UPI003FD192DA
MLVDLSSACRVLLQVVTGRPLFHFTCGFQSKAWHGMWACPLHRSLDTEESIPDHLTEQELCAKVLQQSCPPGLLNIRDEDVVIWVDPLDGTTEYTQGYLDHVTILIGVAVRGRATGGVINQPFYNYKAGPHATLGRCIWGLVGLGSFGLEHGKPPQGQNIITTSRVHSDDIITEAVDACQPTEIVRVGGAGHKMLLLIEGKAHAYIYANPGCQKWDTCAPEAVLHAVGGRLTDILGRPIPYHAHVTPSNPSGLLATVTNHSWYVSHIPNHIKDKFRDVEQPLPPASSL